LNSIVRTVRNHELLFGPVPVQHNVNLINSGIAKAQKTLRSFINCRGKDDASWRQINVAKARHRNPAEEVNNVFQGQRIHHLRHRGDLAAEARKRMERAAQLSTRAIRGRQGRAAVSNEYENTRMLPQKIARVVNTEEERKAKEAPEKDSESHAKEAKLSSAKSLWRDSIL